MFNSHFEIFPHSIHPQPVLQHRAVLSSKFFSKLSSFKDSKSSGIWRRIIQTPCSKIIDINFAANGFSKKISWNQERSSTWNGFIPKSLTCSLVFNCHLFLAVLKWTTGNFVTLNIYKFTIFLPSKQRNGNYSLTINWKLQFYLRDNLILVVTETRLPRILAVSQY